MARDRGGIVVGPAAQGQSAIRVDVAMPGQDGAQRARQIYNMVRTRDGDLRSARGPTPYEPDRGEGFPGLGRIHGIFHCAHQGGDVPYLYLRAGSSLYRHAGWARGWEEIATDLSDDRGARPPDQWVVIRDRVIWSNGVDQARVIAADGTVVPLGFANVPSAPSSDGPQSPYDTSEDFTAGYSVEYHPNSMQYSWAGNIGTIGEFLDERDAVLREGLWVWAVQWEDKYGNLSAISQWSEPVILTTQPTRAPIWDEDNEEPDRAGAYVYPKRKYTATDLIDDLLRQFAVAGTGRPPAHARYQRLLRCTDRKNTPGLELRLVARLPGTGHFFYPDNTPDARLGPVAPACFPVPVFHAMTHHNGSLVIASGPRVLRSQEGFPGTFPIMPGYECYPDSGGAYVTALISHGSRLLAFTETSVYDITDMSVPVQLARGIGCVAMDTLRALPSGILIWLSYTGFYGMAQEGVIQRVSEEITTDIITKLQPSSLCQASATVAVETGEYRCAVTRGGSIDNNLILCYDPSGWRELEFGISFLCLASTQDPRNLVVGGCYEPAHSRYNVMVMDREDGMFSPPSRVSRYVSPWVRFDEVGIAQANVRDIFLVLVDERAGAGTAPLSEDAGLTCRFYFNGNEVAGADTPSVRGVAPDEHLGKKLLGELEVGTHQVHVARTFVRRVPCGNMLHNVRSFSFSVEASEPARFRIAAWAFYVERASAGEYADFVRVVGPTDP